jgi:hypothetical protein
MKKLQESFNGWSKIHSLIKTIEREGDELVANHARILDQFVREVEREYRLLESNDNTELYEKILRESSIVKPEISEIEDNVLAAFDHIDGVLERGQKISHQTRSVVFSEMRNVFGNAINLGEQNPSDAERSSITYKLMGYGPTSR